jgi:hypothetical protein
LTPVEEDWRHVLLQALQVKRITTVLVSFF